MRPLLPHFAGLGLSLLIAGLAAQPAVAQRAPIGVPFDLHDGNLRSDNGTLSFCVDDRVLGWEVDRDIATAIADALLLEPRFVYITEELGARSHDYTGVPDNVLFILLDDKCDAFLGMPLGERVIYPEFITPSPPYLTAHFMIGSAVPGIDALDDFLGEDAPRIGVPIQSPMVGAIAYFAPETRLHVFPYEEKLLEGIRAGKVPAGMFLTTTLTALLDGDIAAGGLTLYPATGLPTTEWPIGMILLNNRTYIRELISDAIRTLTADGTIADILTAAGLEP